jgi:uncharacterized delta-60 repeat protein
VGPDGRIVVAGSAAISPAAGFFQHDFAVARYDEDGTADPAFGGGDGQVTTDFGGGTDLGNDVALDADGRIIVGGQVEQSTASGLVRYDSNGDLDTSFDGGPVITSSGGRAIIKGVAVRPDDGRIVVAGNASSGGSEQDFALAVYREDGDVDTSFGALGLVTTDVSPGQAFADDFAEDLAIQADGKIVLVGRNTSDTFNDLALVRYSAGGEVDESFGGADGIIVTDFHGSGDRGNDVAIQPDGKIVAAVDASNGGSFSLARALP